MSQPPFLSGQRIAVATVLIMALMTAGAWFSAGRQPAGPPQNLRQAGLVIAKPWSAAQAAEAATLTRHQLASLSSALEEADRHADRAAALALFDPLLELMGIWNEQAVQGGAGAYSACALAAAHLSDGVQALAHGGHVAPASRDAYRAALADCRPR